MQDVNPRSCSVENAHVIARSGRYNRGGSLRVPAGCGGIAARAGSRVQDAVRTAVADTVRAADPAARAVPAPALTTRPVRLGVSMKLLPPVRVFDLNRLLLLTQSAHLEQRAGRSLAVREAEVERANLIREILTGGAVH